MSENWLSFLKNPVQSFMNCDHNGGEQATYHGLAAFVLHSALLSGMVVEATGVGLVAPVEFNTLSGDGGELNVTCVPAWGNARPANNWGEAVYSRPLLRDNADWE